MIYIDFETRSKIDLKNVGSWVYSSHPSTDVICMAFIVDDKPVRLWKRNDPLNLESLRKLIENDQIEAHNVFFERAIWENIMVKRYGWPEIKPEQWRCSAALAAYHAIPRSLENAGAALGLTTVKDQDGKRIMLQLAKTRINRDEFYDETEYADKYEALYEYCKTDVNAERAISEALSQLPAKELRIWQLDQKINHRGVPMDREAIEASINMLNEHVEKLTKEAAELGEGDFQSVNQRDKILKYAKAQGEEIENYTKTGVNEALTKVKNPKVKRILEIRQALGKTSTAKYERMLNMLPADNRVRDTLMYHGAATGRWSGRGIQFQNLPRGSAKIEDMPSAIELIKSQNIKAIEMLYGDFMQFMSTAIRGMLKAPKGKTLIVADFAAIEARVLGWLSRSELMLKQFRDGIDLYKEMAAKIYKIDISEVTSEQRQLGKAAILGAGYGMGAPKFMETCKNWGIEINESLAKIAIYTYRETYPEVKNFWTRMEYAAMRAIEDKGGIKKNMVSGKLVTNNYVSWGFGKSCGDFLKCFLPSGRALHFYKPEIKDKDTPWGRKPGLTFMGEKMGATGGKTWMQVDTYGGKLVENITQAVARDLMAEAMLRIEEAGFEIILSIHDELIAEIPEKWCFDQLKILLNFEQLMSEVPIWATGCPIEAKGWIGKHYKK